MTAGSQSKVCALCKGDITTWEQAEWDYTMLMKDSHATGHGKEYRPPWQPDNAVTSCSRV